MRGVFMGQIASAAFILAGVCGVPIFASAAVHLAEPNMSALTTGLVGYWPLDGQTTNWTTNTTNDLSGQGNTGTLVNMSTTTSPVGGKIGQALKFNGSNTAVSIPSISSLISTPVSMSIWFNLNSTAQSANLMSGTSKFDYIQYNVGGSGQIRTSIQTGSGSVGVSTSGYTFTSGKWYHVVLTYDGSSSVKLFVNGLLQASAAQSGSLSGPGAVVLGQSFAGAGYLSGSLDDARIYTRALSAQEVALLYAVGTVQAGNTQAANSSFSIAQSGLNSGLVGYWPFDGNTTNWTTNTTQDVSGNGNIGALASMSTTTSPVPGKIGQALKFNGSSYVQVTNSTNLQLSSGTVSAWIKTTGAGSGFRGIIIKQLAYGIFLGAAGCSDNTLALFDWGGSTAHCSGSANLADGKWHYVALTFQSGVANGSTFYVDGSSLGKTSMTVSSQVCALVVGTGGPLGTTPCITGVTQLFNGTIDDPRVYNRVLSAQEIQQLYASGAAAIAHSNTNTQSGVGINAGLVGYWTFDGPNINWRANTATDVSGNGNTGTLVNMSTSSSPVAGKIGQALMFNGSNQCVALGTALSVQNTNQITIAGWIYPKSFSNYNAMVYTATNSGWWLQTLITADVGAGYIRMGAGGNVGHYVNSTSAIPLNKWTFLVGTFNGTVYNLYINGVLNSSASGASTISDSGLAKNIGSTPGCSAQNMNGYLDGIRIYNRALSAQEVQQLYSAGR